MWRWAVITVCAALAVVATASFGGSDARATISGSGMCWVPDWEFPIPCDDIDED